MSDYTTPTSYVHEEPVGVASGTKVGTVNGTDITFGAESEFNGVVGSLGRGRRQPLLLDLPLGLPQEIR